MSGRESTFNAIREVIAKIKPRPVPDDEIDCGECQGTGLAEGPDGPPCEYCGGSGIW